MAWTEDDDKRLKQLWAEGLTASQIAARMHSTRNAILGRAHRIKLPRRMDGSKHTNRVFASPPKQWYRNVSEALSVGAVAGWSAPRSPVNRQRPTTIRLGVTPPRYLPQLPTEPLPLPVDDYFVAPENRKGVLDLKADDCRWPIGDPKQPGFHFCDGKASPGLPYCAHHAGKAYHSPAEIAAREARKRAA